ncbi:MAG: hypothetical protein HY908_01700 [Myxococcales bacterium]|nr:hypothetical protein [Myxococcales bacterium]
MVFFVVSLVVCFAASALFPRFFDYVAFPLVVGVPAGLILWAVPAMWVPELVSWLGVGSFCALGWVGATVHAVKERG